MSDDSWSSIEGDAVPKQIAINPSNCPFSNNSSSDDDLSPRPKEIDIDSSSGPLRNYEPNQIRSESSSEGELFLRPEQIRNGRSVEVDIHNENYVDVELSPPQQLPNDYYSAEGGDPPKQLPNDYYSDEVGDPPKQRPSDYLYSDPPAGPPPKPRPGPTAEALNLDKQGRLIKKHLKTANLQHEGKLVDLRVVLDRNERLLNDDRPGSHGFIAQLRNAVAHTEEMIAKLEGGEYEYEEEEEEETDEELISLEAVSEEAPQLIEDAAVGSDSTLPSMEENELPHEERHPRVPAKSGVASAAKGPSGHPSKRWLGLTTGGLNLQTPEKLVTSTFRKAHLQHEGELVDLRVVLEKNERLLNDVRPASNGFIVQLRSAIGHTKDMIKDLEKGGNGKIHVEVVKRKSLFPKRRYG